ncbi:MAG: glycosyl transferase family 36, partial [Candidatus Wallbacteria bacterium]|nr:glycosyl transferase family 36 [Candidatus Wallbacteria bacterium]
IVQHWWHPVSEEGRINEITDNLLWLPFATLEYLDETGDLALLDESVPYLDQGHGSIQEHCLAAIDKALSRMSKRGLSLIGEGDWNDGMNGMGVKWLGESVWLSIFLFGILRRTAALMEVRKVPELCRKYAYSAEALKTALFNHAFNGKWFIRATDDSGRVFGNGDPDLATIFLNPQSWAVITGLVQGEEARTLMKHVEDHLFRDYGVLLFYPPFKKPDRNIGYLSRYAPGVRENGGVYTHAAVWSVIAQGLAENGEHVFDTFRRICPTLLSNLDADRYKGEPYVTPGNIEGPGSIEEGKGAWTWYSGSAAWMYRAIVEYLLGVRVEGGKLVVKPCIPASWKGFTMERNFRGQRFRIEVQRDSLGQLKQTVTPVAAAAETCECSCSEADEV